MRAALAVTSVMLVVLDASPTRAEPQGNAALTLGGAGVGAEGEFWDHAEFHLGMRGDVMFGRDDASDFGAGPYLEVGTLAFDEIDFGGGAELLLPIHDSLPLVVSAGAIARYGDDDFGVEPGIVGALFWGTRSYNFHANYVLAAGLLVSYRYSFGDSQESALLIAGQVDLALLAMPVILLVEVIRGPTADAGPIE